MNRIVKIEESKCPPQTLEATIADKRCRGRLLRAIRDVFLDEMRLVITEISNKGDAHEYIGHSKFENNWSDIVKRKEQR